MDDLINFLRDAESQRQPSYEETLEQHKRILIKQREVNDFKKLALETDKFRQQLIRDDRQMLIQADKTKALCHRIDELKIEVQSVIDKNIGHAFNLMEERCHQKRLNEEQREKKRKQIGKLKQQLESYEAITKQIRDSKGQTMLQQAKADTDAEKKKYDVARLEIDNIWKERRKQEQQERAAFQATIVEMANLWTNIKQREAETDALTLNIELMKTKIVQLKEDVELKRVQEIEEAKRLEIEMNERVLTPMKIVHTEIDEAFKNPNDFPAIVDKIELSRRSYEHIFKRPEYVELRNRRKHKSFSKKCKPKAVQHLLSNFQEQLKAVSQSQPLPEQTKSAATRELESTQPSEHQQQIVRNETTKELTPPTKDNETSLDKHSSSDQHRHAVVVPAKQSRKRTKPSRSQPVTTPKLLQEEDFIPPAKRVTSIGDGKPSKPSKSQPEPVTVRDELPPSVQRATPRKHTPELVAKEHNAGSASQKRTHRENPKALPNQETLLSASPERSAKSSKKHKDTSHEADVEEKRPETVQTNVAIEQHRSDEDTNVDNSPQARHGQQADSGALFDTVSLSGSISSLEMEDRGASSDLGFDLSPISSTNGGRDGGSGGSNGADLDFDFLSNSPQQSATSEQKKSNDFDFFGDKSSGGFDFF